MCECPELASFFCFFSLFISLGGGRRRGGAHYIVHMVFASLDAAAEPRPFFFGAVFGLASPLFLADKMGGGSLYIHHREATFISAAPRKNTHVKRQRCVISFVYCLCGFHIYNHEIYPPVPSGTRLLTMPSKVHYMCHSSTGCLLSEPLLCLYLM